MNEQVKKALATEKVIDITTNGRKTGKLRRIEIWFHNMDSKIYITGMPGRKRDWYRNMLANPQFIFHLKESVKADLAARANPIVEEDVRRAWFSHYLAGSDRDLEAWISESPLVEVSFEE
jgi:deazaflavin-dependent oxidoreductase (nitroreductase family)